jgi:hypothetical protein
MVVMIKKNKIKKYNLKDIIEILWKQKLIILSLIVIQLALMISYNNIFKNKYNILIRYTALDFTSYEKIFLVENKRLVLNSDGEIKSDNINILHYTPYTLFHSFIKKVEKKYIELEGLKLGWSVTGSELNAFFYLYDRLDKDISVKIIDDLVFKINEDLKNDLIEIAKKEFEFLNKKLSIYQNSNSLSPSMSSDIEIKKIKLIDIITNLQNTKELVFKSEVSIKNTKKKVSTLIFISILLSIVLTLIYSLLFKSKNLK